MADLVRLMPRLAGGGGLGGKQAPTLPEVKGAATAAALAKRCRGG